MDALILTLFVSLMLAGAGIGFFIWSVKEGTHEHDERLALLPIEDDDDSPEEETPEEET